MLTLLETFQLSYFGPGVIHELVTTYLFGLLNSFVGAKDPCSVFECPLIRAA